MGLVVRLAAATVALIGALALVGVIAVAAGEATPDRWVADALVEARADGLIDPADETPTRLGNVADHGTECLAVSIGLGEAPDAGFVETIVESPHLGPCSRLVAALDDDAAGAGLGLGDTSLRFWHGTSGPFRWITAGVGLGALRVLGFVFMLVATGVLGRRVALLVGRPAAVGLVAPLALTSDFTELVGVVHHSTSMGVLLLGGFVTLTSVERRPTRARSWFAPVLAGACFAYVDLFTHVAGAWLLPVALVLVAGRAAGRRPAGLLRLALFSGTGWLVGYAGMWSAKWLLAAPVLGWDRVVDDVGDAVDFAIDGDGAGVEHRFGAAISDNVDYWLGRPLTGLVLLASALIVAVRLVDIVRYRPGARGPVLIGMVPAVLPLVWFEVVHTHSQLHHEYTYRSLPIALGVVLMAVLAEPGRGRADPVHRVDPDPWTLRFPVGQPEAQR